MVLDMVAVAIAVLAPMIHKPQLLLEPEGKALHSKIAEPLFELDIDIPI